MSKDYPSNLTRAQYELLSDLLPEVKPGGRPREVAPWKVLNTILYLLVEGCRWRALPGDFPPWQTVYTYFRNWRKDGTWVIIHDHLREWTRIEQDRHRQPSEAVIDSQSVRSAAMVHKVVGHDPYYGQAAGMIFDPSDLFKRPLNGPVPVSFNPLHRNVRFCCYFIPKL